MTPTLHRTRLEQLAAHLIANRDQHDQGQFAARAACGTWYCAAGWALVLHGGFDIMWNEFDPDEPTDGFRGHCLTALAYTAYDHASGHFIPIDEAAAGVLGLDPVQAGRLFYSMGDTDEIIVVIRDFLNEAV